MSMDTWLLIGILVLLILCCVLPMALMSRRPRVKQ